MKRYEEWTVAYRKRQDQQLLPDSQERPFQTIPNTWRYWAADPHLLEYEGQTYVFAELYDRVLRRGVIGYCRILSNGCTKWKVVIKKPYHLSYPHVFSSDGVIYMIPESFGGKEIALYRADSFPNQWVKHQILKENCIAVDSTVFSAGGLFWMQTLEYLQDQPAFHLYGFHNGTISNSPLLISDSDENSRPAGSLFRYNGKLMRPAQDSSQGYGCALNFYHVTELSEESYREVLLTKVLPSSIRSDLASAPQGIHTYNTSAHYEVIDLKEYRVDWLSYVMRPVWFIWRRVKRVLGR